MTARAFWTVCFWSCIAVQCWALYAPRTPSVPGPLPLDKVVHLSLFAAAAALGVRAGIPSRWLLAGLVLQAAVSEFAQGALLSGRSGDIRDFAADAAGVAIGLLLGSIWTRRAAQPAHADEGPD